MPANFIHWSGWIASRTNVLGSNSWGLEPSSHTWSQQIKAKYPKNARRVNAEGRTAVSTVVSRYGRLLTCEVKSSSGSEELDDTTCIRFLKYAQFNPARDDAGIAVEGSYSGAVVWKLPF
ncbi:energy transducer TonB [Novosphingobium colocasiae]|uniref:energy transducer TonB n=1 Tax=Novosphingobium colocasiae TaxID=1256513 RepID=UPI003570BEEC